MTETAMRWRREAEVEERGGVGGERAMSALMVAAPVMSALIVAAPAMSALMVDGNGNECIDG